MLVSISKEYARHEKENGRTMLSKIYGFFTLKKVGQAEGTTKSHFMVMENLD